MKKLVLVSISVLVILSGCTKKEEVITSTETSVEEVSKIEDYFEIYEANTDFGLIQIPILNEALLTSEEVKEVNQKFQNIKEELVTNIRECIAQGGKGMPAQKEEILCKVDYAQYDTNLSILVSYSYVFGSPVTLYEGCNIDLTTKDISSNGQVLKVANKNVDDIKESLFNYAYGILSYENDYLIYLNHALNHELVNEKELLPLPEDNAREIANISENLEDLVIYLDEQGTLKVKILIDLGYEGGIFLIPIRKDNHDTQYYDLTRHAMSKESAKAAAIMGEPYLDEFEGLVNAEVVGMEYNTDIEGGCAYQVNTYEDSGTLLNKWLIGVFSGDRAYYDEEKATYVAMNKVSSIVLDDTNTQDKDALALIYNCPNEYEVWSVNPYYEEYMVKDLHEYSDQPYESMLLVSTHEGTKVNFYDVERNNTMYGSYKLHEGEAMLIHIVRSELPQYTLEVSWENHAASYTNAYGGEGVEYIVDENPQS